MKKQHKEFQMSDKFGREEIDRRLAAYDRGETNSMTVDQTMKSLRKSLGEKRGQQSEP
jgi:DNA-binding response OmpR family regulator